MLSAALGASALVGIRILATDYWLWSAAPTHAYGLTAFVALDFALIVAGGRGKRLSLPRGLLNPTAQLLEMAGDIVPRETPWLPAGDFFSSFLSASCYPELV